MEVGLSLMFHNWADFERSIKRPADPPVESDTKFYREELAVGDLAEPLGFNSLWTVEHHFTNYCLIPNPPQLLTYFAARTQRIDLGTMVVVLPWHDPIRLAEAFLMLDQMLADGRKIIIGVGRGAARREFEGMRVPMSESRERFTETLDVLRLAMTETMFSYEGKYFQLQDIAVRPRPRDPNLIDRMICSFMSTQSLEMAADAGLGMLFSTGRPPIEYVPDIVNFNKRRATHGWGAIRPTLFQCAYCGETAKEARDTAVEYMGHFFTMSNWHYGMSDAANFDSAGVYEWWAEQARALSRVDQETVNAMFAKAQIAGTPGQCIDQIREMQRTCNPERLNVVMRIGGMSYEQTKASMELFAREVLPEIRQDPSPEELVDQESLVANEGPAAEDSVFGTPHQFQES